MQQVGYMLHYKFLPTRLPIMLVPGCLTPNLLPYLLASVWPFNSVCHDSLGVRVKRRAFVSTCPAEDSIRLASCDMLLHQISKF